MTVETGTIVLAQAGEAQPPSDLGQILAEEVQSETALAPDPQGPGMPQLDTGDFAPQLVWLAITFVALYVLMSRVALPRIATVIESRRDRVASDLDTAARLRGETDEVIAAYEAELAAARNKSHAIAAQAREKVASEAAAERAEVEAEIAARTAQAEQRISAARAAAMAEIGTTAQEAAAEIVTALVGVVPTGREVAAAVAAARET